MTTNRNILFFLLMSFLFSCDNKLENEIKEYPEVESLEISEISESGATFSATIKNPENYEIISYGFQWAKREQDLANNSNQRVISDNISNGTFSARIEATLEAHVEYFVRVFITTEHYTFYSETDSFESLGSGAPQVLSITPTSASPGDTVVVRGQNLSYVKEQNVVRFGTRGARVFRSTDTLLLAEVPEKSHTNVEVSVEIAGNKSVNNPRFSTALPVITNIERTEVEVGDTLVITGDNFGWFNTNKMVRLNGSTIEILKSDYNRIEAKVPTLPISSGTFYELEVIIGTQRVKANEPIRLLIPEVTAVSSERPILGEELTFSGRYFNQDSELVKVRLTRSSQVIFCEITEHSPSTLSFKMPDNLWTAEFTISIVFGDVSYFSKTFLLAPPVVDSIEPSHITSYPEGDIIIRGKNFSPDKAGNHISIGGYSYPIKTASGTELEVELSDKLLGNNMVSQSESFDLRLTIAQQSVRVENALTLDYLAPWLERSEVPFNITDQHIVFTHNDHIYAGMRKTHYSNSNGQFWRFSPKDNNWTRLANHPINTVRVLANFIIGDDVYYISRNNEVWKYNINADNWSQLSDFPGRSRHYSMSFSIDGNGYFGDSPLTIENDLWRYDPNTDVWTRINDLPSHGTSVTFRQATNVNGEVFLAGGYTNGISKYDAGNDSWNAVSNDMIDSPVNVLSHNNNLLIRVSGDRFTFRIFDTKLNQWLPEIKFPSFPHEKQIMHMASFEKKLFVFCYNSSKRKFETWEYDPNR